MCRIQQAEEKFSEGYACSQAIFSTYCEQFEIDQTLALSLSAGLGGGVCMGKTCGAVTGAILVIGLACGGTNPETSQGRRNIKKSVVQFIQRFNALNGTTECEELLSVNISTPEGMKTALEKGLFKKVCPKFITDSAEILEEILNAG